MRWLFGRRRFAAALLLTFLLGTFASSSSMIAAGAATPQAHDDVQDAPAVGPAYTYLLAFLLGYVVADLQDYGRGYVHIDGAEDDMFDF